MTNKELLANRDAASEKVEAIDTARILLAEHGTTPAWMFKEVSNGLDQAWRDAEARAILAQRKLEREWNYTENPDKDARWVEWKQACNYKKA